MAMTRRAFVRGAAGGGFALALGSRRAARAAGRPNIVFILADDMGYADVGCYGRAEVRTPNLDRLAADGIRLTQGYANSPVCTASRVAIITGRYQYRLPVGLEEPLVARRHTGLPPDHPTLPSLLRGLGYSTTLVGKWHLGAFPEYGPLKSGYEHFYGFRGGALDYFSHHSEDDKPDLWDDDVAVQQAGYLTRLLGDRAVSVVAGARQPFFLSLHFNAPHWPWEGPGDASESERLVREKRSLHHYDGGSLAIYLAMIEEMDRQIGRVLAALQSRAVAEDTIVVFTSDNGGERFSDTWPFTGKKTELLEGGLRIPAIVRWPSRLGRGKVSTQVAMGMDWLPTLVAAAGGAPSPSSPSDGVNLLPLFDAPVPRKVFWRYKANRQRALRDGDWKFLRILGNTFLFNVAADPLERANLKERHRDVHRRLAQEWFAWNRTMLPETAESFTHAFTADELADHYGAQPQDGRPDNPTRADE